MTERYWQDFVEKKRNNPYENNELWNRVEADMKSRAKPKHPLELYSMCKSDNPYIRQVKASPNITLPMVAEYICRDMVCDMQYCSSMQSKQAENWRYNIKLDGCQPQYKAMVACIEKEKTRLLSKEKQLRMMVRGEQISKNEEVEIPVAVKQREQISVDI